MKEKIEALKIEIESAMETTETGRALYELKLKFQAELKTIMSGMKDLPKEDRPTFGKVVNEFKQGMEEKFEARAIVVRQMEMEKKYAAERIDITMPGKTRKNGALHPITLVKNELIDIFAGMGFKIFEGTCTSIYPLTLYKIAKYRIKFCFICHYPSKFFFIAN